MTDGRRGELGSPATNTTQLSPGPGESGMAGKMDAMDSSCYGSRLLAVGGLNVRKCIIFKGYVCFSGGINQKVLNYC